MEPGEHDSDNSRAAPATASAAAAAAAAAESALAEGASDPALDYGMPLPVLPLPREAPVA